MADAAGRGRLDHTWISPPGENLMLSAVLDVSGMEPQEVATLPLVVGLAAATATSLLLLRQTWIKWPNDVLIYHRKLAGILCERHGENVIPLEMVQRAFLKTLAPFYDNWRQNGFAAIHPLIVPCDALKGRQVSVLQTDADPTPVSGLCGGIQPDGTLLVGDTPVFAGEAHVVSDE